MPGGMEAPRCLTCKRNIYMFIFIVCCIEHTLHLWSTTQVGERDQLRGYLSQLLPLLDAYIFEAQSTQTDRSSNSSGRTGRRKVLIHGCEKGGFHTRAYPQRVVAQGSEGRDSQTFDVTEFEALQRRIIVFLGRLGGDNAALAVDTRQALASSLAWDNSTGECTRSHSANV